MTDNVAEKEGESAKNLMNSSGSDPKQEESDAEELDSEEHGIASKLPPNIIAQEAQALTGGIVADAKQLIWNKQSQQTAEKDEGDELEEQDPTLLEEVKDALRGAMWIYGIADLRALGRQGKLKNGDPELIEKVINFPITRVETLWVLKNNLDALKEAGFDPDLYITAIKEEHDEKLKHLFETKNASEDPVTCVVFDDEHSENELVFMISVDTEKKHIDISFRGSVTSRDLLVDTNALIAIRPNPVAKASTKTTIIAQRDKVGVHLGFYDYLMKVNTETGKSKYEIIVEHLLSLLETYPDYSIRTKGHSLGGALATLFAFLSACDDRLPEPITCITVASPRVGNFAFFHAFQELELNGKILHVRVANDKDLIPRLPKSILCVRWPGYETIYKPVGIELRLSSDEARLVYPNFYRSHLRHTAHFFVRTIFLTLSLPARLIYLCQANPMINHSCKEYMVRLSKASKDLQGITMRDMLRNYHWLASDQGIIKHESDAA